MEVAAWQGNIVPSRSQRSAAPNHPCTPSDGEHGNRGNVIDPNASVGPLLRFSDRGRRLLHLIASGHQGGTIDQGPAMILRMRDLKPFGTQIDRHVDEVP
jgi:hypothetical protein